MKHLCQAGIDAILNNNASVPPACINALLAVVAVTSLNLIKMEEVFQNFKHYADWILRNWQTDRVLDSVIIKNELMIERKVNCNGEAYRMLTKEEFNERDSQNFIKIPTIYESDDYQDGHRLAERELDEIDDL